jgi:hypothetical protein
MFSLRQIHAARGLTPHGMISGRHALMGMERGVN